MPSLRNAASNVARSAISSSRALVEVWLDRGFLPGWLRGAFIAATVGFVALSIAFALTRGSDVATSVNLADAVITFVLLMSVVAVNSLAWWFITARLGISRGIGPAFSDYCLSNLSRYLPGSFWYALARTRMAGNDPRTRRLAAVGMLYEVGLVFVAFVLVAMVLGPSIVLKNPAALLISMGLAGLFLVVSTRSSIVESFFGRAISKVMPDAQFRVIPPIGVLTLLGTYVLIVVLMSSGFFFAGRSVSSVGAGHFGSVVGLFAAAWVVGFLVPVTPSGLGVRDGILISGVSLIASPVAAVAAPIAHRLLTILSEVVFAGFGWLILASRRRSKRQDIDG